MRYQYVIGFKDKDFLTIYSPDCTWTIKDDFIGFVNCDTKPSCINWFNKSLINTIDVYTDENNEE